MDTLVPVFYWSDINGPYKWPHKLEWLFLLGPRIRPVSSGPEIVGMGYSTGHRGTCWDYRVPQPRLLCWTSQSQGTWKVERCGWVDGEGGWWWVVVVVVFLLFLAVSWWWWWWRWCCCCCGGGVFFVGRGVGRSYIRGFSHVQKSWGF